MIRNTPIPDGTPLWVKIQAKRNKNCFDQSRGKTLNGCECRADEDEENELAGEHDESAAKPAWVSSAWGANKAKEAAKSPADEDDERDEDSAAAYPAEPKSLAAVLAENVEQNANEGKFSF